MLLLLLVLLCTISHNNRDQRKDHRKRGTLDVNFRFEVKHAASLFYIIKTQKPETRNTPSNQYKCKQASECCIYHEMNVHTSRRGEVLICVYIIKRIWKKRVRNYTHKKNTPP